MGNKSLTATCAIKAPVASRCVAHPLTFSLTVGQVEPLDASERARKGMGQYPLPVVILARLAVAIQAQGKGVGCGLLQDAIRRTFLITEQAGIRTLVTHPIDEEVARFYTQFGFVSSSVREKQLLLLLKDARRWIIG
jgi:hypothetical protein